MATHQSTSKTCSVCQETKPIEAFAKRQALCRPCKRAYDMAYREANKVRIAARMHEAHLRNKERNNARSHQWYLDNMEHSKATNKAWREAHPEEVQAYSQQYYLENKEECLARMQAWATSHRDRSNAIKKASALAHPETGKRSNRRYRLAHPGRRKATFVAWRNKNRPKMVLYQQKRTATQRNAPRNDLTHAEWEEIKAAYGHCCVYCGRQMQRLTMDHLTPLSQGGSHTKQNVVPACKSCNSKKGTGAVLQPVQPLLL